MPDAELDHGTEDRSRERCGERSLQKQVDRDVEELREVHTPGSHREDVRAEPHPSANWTLATVFDETGTQTSLTSALSSIGAEVSGREAQPLSDRVRRERRANGRRDI